ncbi:Zn2Cys6 DNA-binding transcription factor [Fusarium globosum]|uniref:Zn2Cys6 DNA-binding transcription factor n=1 Tax=Fusarium globosum TaxID=78864 RepID=A0A8H5Y720_9HYPO|nr:Zn2Cys6 DNA-binding transcription factor [Fusarium globosum]
MQVCSLRPIQAQTSFSPSTYVAHWNKGDQARREADALAYVPQRRCDRLNQPCGYSPISQRRTRDEQLQELQERLAKTEAQLALEIPRTRTASMTSHLQPPSTTTAPILPSRWPDALGAITPDTNTQYHLATTASSHVSTVPGSVGPSTGRNPMDLDSHRNMGTAIDLPTNSSPMLDIDLFNPGADSNIAFDWCNPLTALEPLDNILPTRLSPRSLAHSGTEEEISHAELNTLHKYYFESIYFSFPFLDQDRFAAESMRDGLAISALIYAVALAGCAHSSTSQNKESACYVLARNYAEKCERDDQLNDLNLLQALLFIGRYEAMAGKLERTWMTLGRAVMLSRLLGLPYMDKRNEEDGFQDSQNHGGSGLSLPATTDQVLLEERRRTFWALYILLSYVKTRTGWQCMLGDIKKFYIDLPSPGLLRSGLLTLKMPYLSDIDLEPSTEISSYAGCVLMVELALRCFDHGQKRNSEGFWDGYCDLVKRTDVLFGMLKQHLNATSIREDPVAFSLYLNLRATEIFSHESAIARSEEQGLPPLMTAESQRRATAAAFQVSTAVRLNLPSPGKAENDIIMLQAIFIAWPLTMALKAFHRELMNGGDRDSINGVVASSRLLFAALHHIEESGGHWHRSVAQVERKLQEWEEKNTFNSLTL